MTEFMKDILKQPRQLINSLNLLLGPERATMEQAADVIRQATHLFITGIGSSWHGGMAVQSVFHIGGQPAGLIEASELLHAIEVAKDSAVVVISRSGKSIEIVQLVDKLK